MVVLLFLKLMLSTIGPVIKEIAKQAAAAAESGKSAKKGKGKEKDAAVSEISKYIHVV